MYLLAKVENGIQVDSGQPAIAKGPPVPYNSSSQFVKGIFYPVRNIRLFTHHITPHIIPLTICNLIGLQL
jgi:hypothetical protein